ncbi:MAG: outer membrane beta-barrel protein [Gemmatimonadota bacterium]
MIRPTIALAATLLLVTGSSLAAQDTAPHSGFWLSGGLGGGTTDTDSDDDSGPAAYLRMGGTPSERLLLGGEIIGLSRDVGSSTVSQANATFSLLYHPSSPGGFFAKAGAGFASAVVSTDVGGGTFETDESGFGLTFGAGYDVRLGRNLFLTPNFDILVQSFDEFADSNLFLLTVGIGFH